MLLHEKRVLLANKGREFLRNLRLSRNLPKQFIKSYQTIISWENGKNNPTLTLFQKYISFFGLNLNYFKKSKFLIKILPSIQELGTQQATKISKDKHKLIVNEYHKGISLETMKEKYSCCYHTLYYILKKYNIDTAKHGSGENYSFPESNYMQHLINLNFTKEEILPLISSLLFTDGCLYSHKKGYEMSYYGTDTTLHKIFADLVWYYFKIKPSSYMIQCGRVLRTKYIDKNIARKLLELSPIYKTKPASKENWKYFLKFNKAPTLSFMKKYPIKVIKESIRLAMCADGCISVANKRSKIFFTLMLGCAHPTLVKEWAELFEIIGVKNNIVKGQAKTKIAGVKGIGDCISKFLDAGGFINDVKVCVRKSPFYGIEKQKLLELATNLLKKYGRINTIPISKTDFKKLL